MANQKGSDRLKCPNCRNKFGKTVKALHEKYSDGESGSLICNECDSEIEIYPQGQGGMYYLVTADDECDESGEGEDYDDLSEDDDDLSEDELDDVLGEID